jgi:hypothetical protein
MLTTATSHRSRATLLDVAKSHASSRTLSGETREVFQHLVNGETMSTLTGDGLTGLSYTADMIDDAFFEAAASCATRAGQSYSRRVMLSDLMALRDAYRSNESIRPKSTTLTIEVLGDADAMRRALLDFNHDGTRVVYVSTPKGK